MRKYIAILLLPILMELGACKDFLNVEPLTSMSGNNYWKSEKDVEQFTRGLYNQLRDKIGMNFFIEVGDLRSGPWIMQAAGRDYITMLARNQIDQLLQSGSYDQYFHFSSIPQWQDFYKIINGVNIMLEQIDEVEDSRFSTANREKYKAEGHFIRNLCYFFMVRVYGDVPYYTEAYHQDPLPRTPMVQVINECLEDMGEFVEDLPWTYDDPANRAVRAMRGGALVLMMHMNMWNAGFDGDRAEKYWRATDSLGAHLINDNQGAYELLPLKDTKQVFEGRSKEGLFEIPQNLNYGESFGYNTFSDMVLHYPHKPVPSITKSYIYPESKFLEKMFPAGEADDRLNVWFDPSSIHSQSGDFEYLKFVNIFAAENEDENPNDNKIIFRLPDAYLLRAEALNNLEKDEEARKMLNAVRNRANATPSSATGRDLSDQIFWERYRELLGEGHSFYDLVRTKKIVDPEYCFNPISVSAFTRGAWTWPIDQDVLEKNPLIKLNTYWLN